MLSGQEPPTGQVTDLPEEVVLDTPQLSIVAEADACVHGDEDTADRLRTGCPTPGSAWLSEIGGSRARPRWHGRRPAPRPRLRPVRGRRRRYERRHASPRRPRLSRFASFCEAEIALDDGDLHRTAATLAALAEEGSTWTSATARALLALVHAVDGRLGAARSQAATATGQISGPNGPRCWRSAALAMALANVQHGQRTVTLPPVP